MSFGETTASQRIGCWAYPRGK